MAGLSTSFKDIVTSLTNIQVSRYACGAAMTFMFYDYFLTLSDEIEFVWAGAQKMSAVKLMFLWNRYGTMPWIILANYHLSGLRPALSNSFCKFVVVSVAIIQGISIMVGVQLLALRVLALYKNSRKVQIGLFSWLAACHITLLVTVFIAMSRFVPFLMYLPFVDTCYTIPDKLIGYVYFPPILAEAGILGLQVFHHVRRSRADEAFQTPLITTLYRDGYLYFAAVMSLRVLSLFIYSLAPPSLWYLSNQSDFPVSTALVSRFFLQLRGAVASIGPESMRMPTRSIYSQKPHMNFSTSHGLPIQSIPDSIDDTYLQPVQLKQQRRLSTTPL